MAKFDIPLIATIECDDIDQAREAVYRVLDDKFGTDKQIHLSMADDNRSLKDGSRIVLLHPNDTDNLYDPEEYAKKRESLIKK